LVVQNKTKNRLKSFVVMIFIVETPSPEDCVSGSVVLYECQAA